MRIQGLGFRRWVITPLSLEHGQYPVSANEGEKGRRTPRRDGNSRTKLICRVKQVGKGKGDEPKVLPPRDNYSMGVPAGEDICSPP